MEGYDVRSYGDGYADVYDAWYGDLPGRDAAIDLLDGLAGDGPVLELAVGTGRLAVPLVARGHAVVGLDASAPMLERLAARAEEGRVLPLRADMAALPLRPDAGFTLAFVAVNSLFNVFTEAGQRRCLQDVGAALAPGGALVVEAFVPDDRATGAGVVEPRSIEADRVTLFVSRQDPDAQTITGQIVELTASGNRLRPVHLHYLLPGQLDALAADAGLTLDARWADWARTPYDEHAVAHVSVYRRTTGA